MKNEALFSKPNIIKGGITSLIFISLPITCTALIDLKTAGLKETWTDIGKGSLQLTRSYNSRSLHDGLFGYGWCSPWETSLDLTYKERIVLKDCSEAEGLRIFSRGSPDGIYRTRGAPGVRLEFVRGMYLLRTPSGRHRYFDRRGRLRRMRGPDLSFQNLNYAASQLQSVTDEKGRWLKFFYHPTNGKIQRVSDHNGRSSHYRYIGKNLVWAKDVSHRVHRYRYDGSHNMIQMLLPDGKQRHFEYDTATDRVTGFHRDDGCKERFHYELRDPSHYIAQSETLCGQKRTQAQSYEFFYRINPEGTRSLSKMRVKQKLLVNYDHRGRIIEVKSADRLLLRLEYREDLAKPVVIERPGLGRIRVTYKKTGDVDRITSAAGDEAALQVAADLKEIFKEILPAEIL